jgi:hypothetical protein
MHRALKEDTTKPPAASLRGQQSRFDNFRCVVNNERPHEGLNNRVKASVYIPSSVGMPRKLPEYKYPKGVLLRRLNNSGDISWHKTWIFISEVFRFEELAFAGRSHPCLRGYIVRCANRSSDFRRGLGSEADVAPYLLTHYFGRRHFSVLYGLTWTAYAIGGATGPMAIGRWYDREGSYQPRFTVYLACVAFAAEVISLFLPSNREQASHDKGVMTPAVPISFED